MTVLEQEAKLQIHYRRVDDLIPYARNSRRHSDAQIAQIAASIREFGWTNPVLVDGDRGVIAGHGRVLAARRLGMSEVPCIELAGMTGAQKRTYIVADNKLALNAEWDVITLMGELETLTAENIDLTITGFSDEEIAELQQMGKPVIPEVTESIRPIAWTRMLVSVPVGAEIPGSEEYVSAVLAAGGRVDYAGN